jgi:hypothetical protein
MEPVKETVRVARTVEKRVPVETCCYVPRVVCYPTTVDACGVPVECGPSTVISSSPSSASPPSQPSQPTLAPQKKSSAADEKPTLPSSAPGPEKEEPAASAPSSKPTESKPPAKSSDTSYPTKPQTK